MSDGWRNWKTLPDWQVSQPGDRILVHVKTSLGREFTMFANWPDVKPRDKGEWELEGTRFYDFIGHAGNGKNYSEAWKIFRWRPMPKKPILRPDEILEHNLYTPYQPK